MANNIEEYKQLRQRYFNETGCYAEKDMELYCDWLEDNVVNKTDLLHGVSNRTSVDFKKLRDVYFKEHVTQKTTDGIPMVCTHPHNLFEWFKAELKEYGC